MRLELRDRWVPRVAWRGVEQLGHIIGPERARRLAAAVWRRTATNGDRFLKLAHRVSPRLRGENPELFKVPTAWTATSPVVTARRLGLDWELDLRDNLQALLFFSATYEPELIAFLRAEVRSGDVFVDVGANIGVHALTAARRLVAAGGGRVVAFEPAEDTAAKLQRVALGSGLEIELVKAALGAAPGLAPIFADPNYDDADVGVRSQFNSGRLIQSVPVMTFDQWASETGLERLDVVKVDVEGAEPRVLEGMRASLRRLRPRAVIVEVREYSFARVGHGNPEGLRDLMRQFGYSSSGMVLNHNEVFRPTSS